MRRARGRRGLRVIGAVFVLVTVIAGPAASFAVGQPVAAAWHSLDVVPPLGVVLGAGSCPTATECFRGATTQSGDGMIFGSMNGGVTWRPEPVPANTPGVTAIDCPTPVDCYAVTWSGQGSSGFTTTGFEILKSTDSGATWHVVYVDAQAGGPFSNAILDSISCPTAQWCLAGGPGEYLDATLLVSDDGGATWTEVSPWGPDNATVSIESVACPVANTCEVVGEDAFSRPIESVTVNGGETWTPQVAPGGLSNLTDIVCPALGTCLLTGTGGTSSLFKTTDGGTTWSPLAIPDGDFVDSLSCVNASDCFVGGWASSTQVPSSGLVLSSVDGGSAWTPLTVPAAIAQVLDVACGSPTRCSLEANNSKGVELTARLSGASIEITPHPYQVGVELFGTASCATPSACVTTEEAATSMGTSVGVLRTTSAPSGWTAPAGVPGMQVPGYLDCTRAVCLVTGSQANSYPAVWRMSVSHDGGRTWELRYSGSQQLSDESCPTSTTCVVDGSSFVLRTSDAGRTWARLNLPKGLLLDGIACPAPSECVAIGRRQGVPVIVRSTDGAATWAVHPTGLTKQGDLGSVSCTTKAQCVVSGSRFAYLLTPNHPWVETTSDGGSTWQRRSVGGVDDIEELGCTRGHLCVALGINSSLSSTLVQSADSGRDWTPMAGPAGAAPQYVSCNWTACVLVVSTSSGGSAIEATW